MFPVARDAQRLEVREMMGAAERAVLTEARNQVVDLQMIRPALFSGHLLRRDVAAAHAAVLVAPLRRAPGLRPPVVVPKHGRAAVLAPGPAPLRQRFAAPSAAAGERAREGAGREEGRALRSRSRIDSRRVRLYTRT